MSYSPAQIPSTSRLDIADEIPSAWGASAWCEAVLALLESRSPGLLEMLVRRWREGEEWAGQLAVRGSYAPKGWLRKVPVAGVEALLVRSREQQLIDPLVGMKLAETALRLIDVGPHHTYVATGWILFANAARLRQWPRICEEALRRAEVSLGGPIEEGLYCRALGLLRHEQGRGLEALALLDFAGRCFTFGGLEGEAACCLGLRCLLEMESDLRFQQVSSESFLRALSCIELDSQPGLYACLRSALAGLLALGGRRREAEELLSGWRVPKLSDIESAQAQLLYGRAKRTLGDFRAAEDSFAEARQKYWATRRRYEAALASWELAGEYARREAWSELETLAGHFPKVWPCCGETIEHAFRELRWRAGSEGCACNLWLKVVLESCQLRPGPFIYA